MVMTERFVRDIYLPAMEVAVPKNGWSDVDVLNFLNGTYETPTLKEIEIETLDAFNSLNTFDRRELELKIFDAYFSPKEEGSIN